MKRPILKRTVKTIEVVTWTLEYEDVADPEPTPPPLPPTNEASPTQEIPLTPPTHPLEDLR